MKHSRIAPHSAFGNAIAYALRRSAFGVRRSAFKLVPPGIRAVTPVAAPLAKSGVPTMFAFLSLALLLGGCLSRPSMVVQTYAFTTPLTTATNNAPADRVLCIRKLQISPPFDERSLVYRTGDFSYVRDPYAEFLGSPAEELSSSISGILSADGSFRAIVGMGSDAKPDMLVEINVRQLYGDIRKPGSPAAVLSMQVIFVKAPNDLPGQVIFQQNYYSRIPVETASAPAFMKGWNQALSEILAQVASDFREHEND